MVPANDVQEPEPTAPQITAGNKPPTASADSSARLTSLPPWAMHWWTPLLLAGILLAAGCFLASIWRMPLRPVSWWKINLYWPPSWPFNYHWPSKDAMALCATIAGAGFAFSAWQQRSHDNAISAKQARAAIERDDYWKRREQIYQLLGSKNPGLRLSAVALLAELADSAAHSALLNDTEKQQLQRHIIDTLCLQVRHEGLDHNNEGFRDERAQIQTAIIETLLIRIASQPKTRPYANWSSYSINLSNCEIFTSIQITNLNSTAALNFNNTTFHESAIIRDSKIGPISWDNSTFTKGLQAVGTSTRTTIKTNTIPQSPQTISFQYVTFITERPAFSINTNPQQDHGQIQPRTHFYLCDFRKSSCDCPESCACKANTNTGLCTCMADEDCLCNSTCTRGQVRIICHDTFDNVQIKPQNLSLQSCEANIIYISLTSCLPEIHISDSRITNNLFITIEYYYNPFITPHLDHIFDIQIENNIFTSTPRFTDPIRISTLTPNIIEDFITFSGNKIVDHLNTGKTYDLLASSTNAYPEAYHFNVASASNINISEWDTGRPTTPIGIRDYDSPFSAFSCGIYDHYNSLAFSIARAEDSQSIFDLYSKSQKIEETDTNERSTPNEYVSHDKLLSFINRGALYLVTDSLGPVAIFAFIPGPYVAYDEITNIWHSESDYHIISCITATRGRGITHAILNYATKQANYVRCDTTEHNSAMQHSLETFGFNKCGTFVADDGSTRIAYDWIKEPDPQD